MQTPYTTYQFDGAIILEADIFFASKDALSKPGVVPHLKMRATIRTFCCGVSGQAKLVLDIDLDNRRLLHKGKFFPVTNVDEIFESIENGPDLIMIDDT